MMSKSDSMLIGTLNCLGEAFNPFEFLSASNLASCEKLQRAARALTLPEIEASGALNAQPAGGEAALTRLRDHVAAGRAPWEFFDEATLANDNKLLESRVNMLTLAMRDGANGQSMWLQLSTWPAELCAVAPTSSAYAGDANLWLFDLACNVIASSESAAYQSVCGESHLNPANVEANAARFFDQALAAAGESTPIVLGMQEYPRETTPGMARKAEVYAAALESRKLRVVRSDTGVAIGYSTDLGEPTVLDCSSLAPAVMSTCLEEAEAHGVGLDAKERKGFLGTTAAKVMACRFPHAHNAKEHTFVVMHAKEPKTPNSAHVLAAFVAALAKALNAPPKQFVLVSDTNLASAALASAFASRLGQDGYSAAPGPGVDTTAKQRSILHGQCYDTKKCLVLVASPKDKIIAVEGSLSNEGTYPVIKELGHLRGGLPSAAWASDHCLTYARLNLVGEAGTNLIGEVSMQEVSEVVLTLEDRSKSGAGAGAGQCCSICRIS